jgi:RecA-family ATPase
MLITELKAYPIPPAVIVIDTLLRFAKVLDENSSEMDRVMAMARKLVDELQVTIFLISHSSKTLGSRAGNALRGHSSIEGGADAVFRVNSDKDTDIIEIVNEKARRNPIDPINARWTYTCNPKDQQLIEARLYYEPYQTKNSQANQKRQAAIQRLEKDILKALIKLGPTSKNDLIKEIGGNRQRILEVLDELDNVMAITITAQGRSLMCEITSMGKGLI